MTRVKGYTAHRGTRCLVSGRRRKSLTIEMASRQVVEAVLRPQRPSPYTGPSRPALRLSLAARRAPQSPSHGGRHLYFLSFFPHFQSPIFEYCVYLRARRLQVCRPKPPPPRGKEAVRVDEGSFVFASTTLNHVHDLINGVGFAVVPGGGVSLLGEIARTFLEPLAQANPGCVSKTIDLSIPPSPRRPAPQRGSPSLLHPFEHLSGQPPRLTQKMIV